MENLYFANALSPPSQNSEFIDTETQCNLTLRGSTGYVSKGVLDFVFFDCSTVMNDDLFKANTVYGK